MALNLSGVSVASQAKKTSGKAVTTLQSVKERIAKACLLQSRAILGKLSQEETEKTSKRKFWFFPSNQEGTDGYSFAVKLGVRPIVGIAKGHTKEKPFLFAKDKATIAKSYEAIAKELVEGTSLDKQVSEVWQTLKKAVSGPRGPRKSKAGAAE